MTVLHGSLSKNLTPPSQMFKLHLAMLPTKLRLLLNGVILALDQYLNSPSLKMWMGSSALRCTIKDFILKDAKSYLRDQ